MRKRVGLSALLSALAVGASAAPPLSQWPASIPEPMPFFAASTISPPPPLDATATLDALSDPVLSARTGITDLRLQLLRDAARTVGFRGGLVTRAKELVDALMQRSVDMEQMFPFATLVTKDGNLPPVIVEARDVAAFTAEQIRTANTVYDIKAAERFVSVAPTWRDYLLVGLRPKPVELPDPGARPHNDDEKGVWREGVRKGWADGYLQADAILHVNFKRLVRDFEGMTLYSSLLQQGLVSETHVAETSQTVSGDVHQIAIGDTLRRFTAKAGLQSDARKWRPKVAKTPAGTAAATVAAPKTAAAASASTGGKAGPETTR